MTVLLTVAAAAYLHSHPDAFTGAFTLSITMWLAVVVWALLAVVALATSD